MPMKKGAKLNGPVYRTREQEKTYLDKVAAQFFALRMPFKSSRFFGFSFF
jgi:hypothetical protein